MTIIEDRPTEDQPTIEQPPAIDRDTAPEVVYEGKDVPWAWLHAGPNNVRRTSITDASVRELADSIVARGLLQDITVHPNGEIIWGHRRHHAIGLAIREGRLPENHPISVQVASTPTGDRIDEGNILVDRLVENLQRLDLDPIEEAHAFQQIVEFGFSQQQLADQIGVNKSHVSKRLKLLNLVDEVQAKVTAGEITLDHALKLADLPLEAQEKLASASEYAIEGYLAGERKKAAATKLRADLKALGHDVRSTKGKAAEGKTWTQVGNTITSRGWDQQVPKSAEIVIVKVEQWYDHPQVSFWRQTKVPSVNGENVKVPDYVARQGEKAVNDYTKREAEAAEARRRQAAIAEAEARVLLDQASKLTVGQLKDLLYQEAVEDLAGDRWHQPSTVRAALEIAKIKELDEDQDHEGVLARVFAEGSDISANARTRLVVAWVVLSSRFELKRLILDRAGFDPEAVETPDEGEIEVPTEATPEDAASTSAEDDTTYPDDFDPDDYTDDGNFGADVDDDVVANDF